MAPVVPLKAHDAAAGAQVCRLLAAPRLAETGQQKRVRAEPVDGGAVYFCFIIQNLGRMFHTPSRNPPTKYCVPKDEKIMQERKAADPLLTGLLLLMRFFSVRREIIQQR